MLYDITPPITDNLAVWPGDTPPRREVLMDMRKGDNITLSTLHATVHPGAHADAPSHYGADAPAIEQRSLDYYLGPCQVMRLAVPRRAAIGREHLTDPILVPRLLLFTGTFPDPDRWEPLFASLSPALVDHLADHGVVLVGIDTPSIDPWDDKVMESHQAVARRDLAILEGIVLDHVAPGLYTLLALPLRLEGADASPVRAALAPAEAEDGVRTRS